MQAARQLTVDGSLRAAEIAHHYDAAGEPTAALPYALCAAEQPGARYALEVAEQQYLIAERGAEQASLGVRYQVAKGLGEVLLLRGQYDAAEAKLAEAVEFASDDLTQAEIGGKLGEVAFKRGDMERAIACFELALRQLGKLVPRSRLALMLLVAWEGMKQLSHTCLPWLLVHRKRRQPDHRERLILRLLSNLAHGCWYCRGLLHVMWAHLRGMNLAELYVPTPELAQAYAEHAPGLTLVGYLRRAEKYAQKSLAIRRELSDWWGQGQSLHYWGVVLYAGSRYEECIEKCRDAIRLLERTGDFWQVHIAHYQIAASMYRLGNLAGALEEAQHNYQSGLDLGDEQASGINLDIWVRATEGQVPDTILQPELVHRGVMPKAAQVGFAQALCLAGQSQWDQAVQVLKQAISIARRAGVRNAYTLPFLPWLATLLREQALQLKDQTPSRRTKLLRQAEQAARRSIRSSWLCRNDLPHALRELGLIRALRGYPAQALAARSQSRGGRSPKGRIGVCTITAGKIARWPGAWLAGRSGRIPAGTVPHSGHTVDQSVADRWLRADPQRHPLTFGSL